MSAPAPRPPWPSCAALQIATPGNRRNRRESYRGVPAPAAERETPGAPAPSKPPRRAPGESLCRGRPRPQELPRRHSPARPRSPSLAIESLLLVRSFPGTRAKPRPPLADQAVRSELVPEPWPPRTLTTLHDENLDPTSYIRAAINASLLLVFSVFPARLDRCRRWQRMRAVQPPLLQNSDQAAGKNIYRQTAGDGRDHE